MKNEMQMVKEWRKAFALPVSETPNLPSQSQLDMHRRMVVDEADEIGDAATVGDVRDVCVDLIYFVIGLAAESGITAEQLSEDFARVHAANMDKLWTESQANELCASLYDAAELYSNTDDPNGWAVKNRDGSNMFTVRFKGKIQKPPGWQPATLRTIGSGESLKPNYRCPICNSAQLGSGICMECDGNAVRALSELDHLAVDFYASGRTLKVQVRGDKNAEWIDTDAPSFSPRFQWRRKPTTEAQTWDMLLSPAHPNTPQLVKRGASAHGELISRGWRVVGTLTGEVEV